MKYFMFSANTQQSFDHLICSSSGVLLQFDLYILNLFSVLLNGIKFPTDYFISPLSFSLICTKHL